MNKLLTNKQIEKKLIAIFNRSTNYNPSFRRNNVYEAYQLVTTQRDNAVSNIYDDIKNTPDSKLYTKADLIAYAKEIIGDDLPISTWDGAACNRCGQFIGCITEEETGDECTGNGGFNSHEYHEQGICECTAINKYLKEQRRRIK